MNTRFDLHFITSVYFQNPNPPFKNKDFLLRYLPRARKEIPQMSLPNARRNDRLGIQHPKVVIFQGTTAGSKAFWCIC